MSKLFITRSTHYRDLMPATLRISQSFSGPLDEGIECLNNICKSLLDAHVSPTTGMCSNYNHIREHIVHAEQCMEKTEQTIEEKLEHLDERMELLNREKQNVEQQKKEKNMAMDKLNIEKHSAEQSLQNSKAALEQARQNVETAKYALSVAQARRDTGEGVAIAGGVMLAIPIIGWIAGPIMLSEGQRQFNEASNAHSAAENNKQMYESTVSKCTKNIHEYETKICFVQIEIETTSEALREIEVVIKVVQTDLEDSANVQQMVRGAVNLLGVLHGRVSVLEKQTQSFILWEPVVNVIGDVMAAVGNIAENKLFYSDHVQGLINTLKENVNKLQALCNSPSDSIRDNIDRDILNSLLKD